VKAILAILAALVAFSGARVTIRLAGTCAVAVPVPVLFLAAELAAAAVLAWVITRTWRGLPLLPSFDSWRYPS
jgi:hypothetical protein